MHPRGKGQNHQLALERNVGVPVKKDFVGRPDLVRNNGNQRVHFDIRVHEEAARAATKQRLAYGRIGAEVLFVRRRANLCSHRPHFVHQARS